MTSTASLSTAGIPCQHRIDQWNQWISDSFTVLESSPLQNEMPFSGSIDLSSLPRLSMAAVRSLPAVVNHSNSMVQKATEQVFLLHLQLQGRSLNRQAGKAAILETGDFTLCDSSRPYSLEFNDPNNMLVLRIPAPFLRRFIASPEDVVSRHMPGDRGMSAVVSSLLQGHWRNSIEDINPASQQALEESLLNLLTLAYTERMSLQTQDTSPHDALRQRIQLYIDQNAGFLELTPELIANAHGISKRYLHKLFSEAGLTVGRYLLECRLNRARTLLEQTGHQNSIESIGFEAGFSNASYFNRAFKSRFGMTPRQYRSSLLN